MLEKYIILKEVSIVLGTKLTRTLVNIDSFCDYLPVVSTITNLVDIFQKYVMNVFCRPKSINDNYYFFLSSREVDL